MSMADADREKAATDLVRRRLLGMLEPGTEVVSRQRGWEGVVQHCEVLPTSLGAFPVEWRSPWGRLWQTCLRSDVDLKHPQ